MDRNEAIQVRQTGDGRSSACVNEHWTSLQGVHGGVVAALALAATEPVPCDAGDYFPPAVLTTSTGLMRAVTIEYALQIHSAAGQWTIADNELLAARMHTCHSHDSLAVEDGWIWLPDGTLLVTYRQTRLAG